ncbi:hypothetical protein AGDE_12600 [Angomonas deanei]|uniref:Uncharacterized protein n=1 Tax=Angomonas deanei TaxID=59799 RepID=A0A7G2C7R9_9TRYP|nr:hypothetical protein AGDE_12600 [Angomonas deanei]CAD2215081.1 hypothetical protein, conserved [Angomonas deanei]|eukprot:EPY23963.1 hypothetical protein AGDE_12600 [Angomonas deanei]
MGDDAAIYSVVCRLHTPQEGCPPKYTGMPDWMSDVGAPQYKDPPFLFPKLPFNQLTVFIFTLLKITNVHGTPKTQPIAWTITKAFMDDNNVARQGRFVLPWLDDGDCPEAILKRLHTERLDKVFISSLKDKSIQFHEPPSTVTISQGLPLLIPQLVDITAGSPQPRQLLMPGPMKKQFPSYTYEGQVGCTLITQNNMCFNGIVPQELLPRYFS